MGRRDPKSAIAANCRDVASGVCEFRSQVARAGKVAILKESSKVCTFAHFGLHGVV